jgi:hypothetical protein
VKHIIYSSVALFLLIGISASAQEKEEENNWGIKWSGFVKNDFFLDNRQVASAREGQFLLYPLNVSEDIEGVDINGQGSINFLSIQTRLKGSISGPDAFGAKTSGVIEAAFFGHSNPDINGLRLRHAFVKLDWGKTKLLTGQYWHMMFVPECFPGTISFNTGVPFQYFSRNPQIRISQALGEKIIVNVAAMTQRDFTSPGGYTSLSNSKIPDMQAQIQFNLSESVLFGITGGYKQLAPRLKTDANYIANEKLGGFTSNAFLRVKTEPITIKLQGIYAQNAFDGLMIGGFAIREITDLTKDYRDYTPINTLSTWADIHTNGKKWQVGLFAGFSKNLGTQDEVSDLILDPVLSNTALFSMYSRGFNIDYLYRVSPRVIFNSGKFRVAGEIEYTTAAYVTTDEITSVLNMDNYGRISDSEEVSNLRFLVGVYYFF